MIVEVPNYDVIEAFLSLKWFAGKYEREKITEDEFDAFLNEFSNHQALNVINRK